MSDQAKLAEKISEYQKILLQDPKSLVFVPLAGCYLRSGSIEDALETALKGTWELPDYALGYVAVARIYAHRQVYAKAASAFQKAIDTDPSCLDAYTGMAKLYIDQGNTDAASNFLTKAIFLFPDEPSLQQMLEALTPVSSPPPVEPAVVAPVQEQNSMEPITTATIAEIYIKQGFYDKALDVYRELFAETSDPSVAQKIAEIEIMAQGGASQEAVASPVAEVGSSSVNDSASHNIEPERMSGESVLDNLNSMLVSIQARRKRV